MRICIVRHGETDSNLEGIIQGHVDIALNETGRGQAKRLGERFRGHQFDIAYSSDLTRVLETAQFALEYCSVPLEPRPELRERSFGEFEGKPGKDYREALTNSNLPFQKFRPIGGESIEDLEERVQDFLVELWEKHAEQSVLLVAHHSTNRMLIRLLNGWHGYDEWSSIEQSNTGVTMLTLTSEQGSRMVMMNCTVHLQSL